MHPNPNGQLHDSRGGTLSRLYKREVRSWDAANKGKPIVHSSVFKRQKEITGYNPWILQMDIDEWTESL